MNGQSQHYKLEIARDWIERLCTFLDKPTVSVDLLGRFISAIGTFSRQQL